VSVWRSRLPRWTPPRFAPARKQLQLEALYHPLVADAVPNSLDVTDTSVLVTGSNMSGKTTFVRALGVGAVLAQTLHTACAADWCTPLLRVRTSIGRADSVVEGKSYYLAEVESVAALVRAQVSGVQHLFLLDEIFRGTNTTERVAAGFAVLSYLNRGVDIVVVATHDIELIGLLGESFATKHFREEIAHRRMTFDYRIHDGPSSSRNAIALLGVMDLPADLVTAATSALDWQSRLPTGAVVHGEPE
jgi:DNA mismatch repair ATPase MutS